MWYVPLALRVRVAPTFSTLVPVGPTTLSAASSTFLIATGPWETYLTPSLPLTRNQWQPGSFMTIGTTGAAVPGRAKTRAKRPMRSSLRTTDLRVELGIAVLNGPRCRAAPANPRLRDRCVPRTGVRRFPGRRGRLSGQRVDVQAPGRVFRSDVVRAADVDGAVHDRRRGGHDRVVRCSTPDLVADELSARPGAPGQHVAVVLSGVDDAVRHRRRGEHVGLRAGPEVEPERRATRLAAARGVEHAHLRLEADVNATARHRR